MHTNPDSSNDCLFSADGTAATTLPSPGSSIRDGAQRILQLCQKSEWPPLDQALKVVEKLVAAGGDDVTSTPLAGVVDQVIFKEEENISFKNILFGSIKNKRFQPFNR